MCPHEPNACNRQFIARYFMVLQLGSIRLFPQKTPHKMDASSAGRVENKFLQNRPTSYTFAISIGHLTGGSVHSERTSRYICLSSPPALLTIDPIG